MPHGHDYLWTPELLWTYVISDTAIFLACYSIPLALLSIVRRRRDLRFSWIIRMFSVLIFACGTTHLIAVWTIWNPAYWLDAAARAATAIVSVATAAVLWKALPRVLQIPSIT